jgi:pimeloyl-ACP methyl ester carboxylesterase
VLAVLLLLESPLSAATCGVPTALGDGPNRLLVIVPGTGQGPAEWASFLAALRREPRSRELAWLVYDHGVTFTSMGQARDVASGLNTCIQEKVGASSYARVTLVGHSIGGMLARRAYLEASGAFPDTVVSAESWARNVDSILLFASVNKGIPHDATWWGRPAAWLLRTLPHPPFVLEDLAFGSDFIADVRIAWIRFFGELQTRATRGGPAPPRVVQFWGTRDSVVTERDNADLEAFSGPVIERVADAPHGDLPRLEPEFAPDPQARWAIFRRHLFDDSPPRPAATYRPQRVLFIARGIRDSSNSEWVSDLKTRGEAIYGKGNVEDFEYGYFSAAHFALRPLRSKRIPDFRDLYAERLARNPLTEFDFIGHSNGTYILGQSLLSTPSMRFRHVALAAPVLPIDFNWRRLFQLNQVQRVRYDTSLWDWPVGILCPLLRAVGFMDVGPSGLVLFATDSRVDKVGWHMGGHGKALDPENRTHLLNFATTGSDLAVGGQVARELGVMNTLSRATPWLVWALLVAALVFLVRFYHAGRRISARHAFTMVVVLLVVYAVLDIV